MEQSSDVGITALPPVLDLTAAGPLAADLLGRRGAPLMIDGSGVQRLGAQCLQVLMAAKATWAADGNYFSVEAPSDALTETLAALGAADLVFQSTEENPA
ncbi:STAS domain-containing protein [Acidisphaera sp. L21]|uniref:STAS domain-containing protein n=1 Tax=Acidisphaera sp. L21 TaxID=1641851 RepID=UPI00131E6B5E|nr:STAS domain-containing protein [Acidisphaera sp. L21]